MTNRPVFIHRTFWGYLALMLVIVSCSAKAQTPITTVQVGTGYDRPLFLTNVPGDSTRLFIVEQDGAIKIIKNGSPLATPFMDIDSIVRSTANEQGLLGLAFHPNYANNGFFYVYYTRESDGAMTMARYSVSGNPDIANANSRHTLFTIPDFADNHNGGMMAFHPDDGYLYIGIGDGGSFNDPGNRAQNLDSLQGKILRIDVDTTVGYKIPPSNPFATAGGTTRKEIWAYGKRNPWRWSFDRVTGDLWIADVGQGNIEEINFEPDSAAGGRNYGWRRKEGVECFIPASNCDTLGVLTDPITQFFHTNGRCSITGGYVYRGCAIPDLQGTYFYGDYCTGEIWSIRYNGTTITDSLFRNTLSVAPFNLVSFGEDAVGEMYIVRRDGTIRKIIPNGVAPQACGPCCVGEVGNVDNSLDGTVDIGDLTILVDHLFISFMPLPCPAEGNIDVTGGIDIGDLTVLVDHLFISFLPLLPCP